jgi:flagellar basal-body rod protein FlgF
MVVGMLEAVQGCLKEQARMDILSNNLANASTAGYKASRVSFQDMVGGIGSTQHPSPRIEPTSPPPPVTDALISVKTDFSQGSFRFTGNSLDLAVHGDGLFKVRTLDGDRYTRKGNFSLDGEGYLITSEGSRVLGKGGPIAIAGDRIEVDREGRILVDGSVVGQLDVVRVPDPQALVRESGLLFRLPEGSEELPVTQDVTIQQGYLEDSNVNVAGEMVTMIHSMRAFESYQKAMGLLDGLDDRAINHVGRVR